MSSTGAESTFMHTSHQLHFLRRCRGKFLTVAQHLTFLFCINVSTIKRSYGLRLEPLREVLMKTRPCLSGMWFFVQMRSVAGFIRRHFDDRYCLHFKEQNLSADKSLPLHEASSLNGDNFQWRLAEPLILDFRIGANP